MFYWYLTFVTIAFISAIHVLRAFQKHALTELRIVQYQKKVMDYLRSNDPLLTKDDYEKLKEMLSINEKLMEIHKWRPSSIFHARHFLRVINRFVRCAYEMDMKVQSFRSDNPNVLTAKQDLDSLIMWTVFYNAPQIVKLWVVLTLVARILTLQVTHSTAKGVNNVMNWYNDILVRYSKDTFTRRLSLATNFLTFR